MQYVERIVFIFHLIIIIIKFSCDTMSFEKEQKFIMFDLIKQFSQLCIEFCNDSKVLSTFFNNNDFLEFQLFMCTIKKLKRNVNTKTIMMSVFSTL